MKFSEIFCWILSVMSRNYFCWCFLAFKLIGYSWFWPKTMISKIYRKQPYPLSFPSSILHYTWLNFSISFWWILKEGACNAHQRRCTWTKTERRTRQTKAAKNKYRRLQKKPITTINHIELARENHAELKNERNSKSGF